VATDGTDKRAADNADNTEIKNTLAADDADDAGAIEAADDRDATKTTEATDSADNTEKGKTLATDCADDAAADLADSAGDTEAGYALSAG